MQDKKDVEPLANDYVPKTVGLKSSALQAKSIFSQVAVSVSANPFAAGKEAAASLNPFSNKNRDTGASLNPFLED